MKERIPVSLEAKIILKGKRLEGTIQNLSAGGMMISANKTIKVSVNEIVEIKFKPPSHKTFKLRCRVKWFTTMNDSSNFKFRMGMQIIDPPVLFKDYFNSIYKYSVSFTG
ncbi:MAG: PilZ domain-containing protein [Nitrospiraceae bacterium]|nr:MAG: PilZ domain-containing protein [Nitrospiraceae bacterium]